MKTERPVGIASMVALLLLLGGPLPAEDTVTIPKARLQELERKEAELNKLRGGATNATGENLQLGNPRQADASPVASPPQATPVVTNASPSPASLPPLQPAEIVEASDLANHYRGDVLAADQRYLKRTFQIRGEIERFEKPLFTRNYKILLKTSDRQMLVVCDFFPPDKYSAVFTVNNGLQLVGLVSGTRVPIVRVGDHVVIEGRCKGVSDSAVRMAGCELKSTR